MTDPNLIRFRTLVAGALAHLESRRQEINDLNVFPVADGDTGDNMVLTLRAVVEELDRLGAGGERTIDDIGRDEIVDAVARAALLGARGNSGVILSQLIRGAAEELVSRPGELMDATLIGAALARAADRAYASVRDPAEGTILTVVREMAHRVAVELAHMPDTRLGPDVTSELQDDAIAGLLERAVAAGEASVLRTPELLAVLRDAGVVDAGGYALVVIFAGIVAALRGDEPPPLVHHAPARVTHPNLTTLGDRECRQEIEGSKVALEKQLGRDTFALCFPGGFVGSRERDQTQESGLTYGITCEPGLNTPETDPFLIRRVQIDQTDSLGDFAAKARGSHDHGLVGRGLYRRLRYGSFA